jgi:hypothetical protein
MPDPIRRRCTVECFRREIKTALIGTVDDGVAVCGLIPGSTRPACWGYIKIKTIPTLGLAVLGSVLICWVNCEHDPSGSGPIPPPSDLFETLMFPLLVVAGVASLSLPRSEYSPPVLDISGGNVGFYPGHGTYVGNMPAV